MGANTSLAIASADPGRLTEHLARIAEHVHLVTPATVIGHLPEGFEVVMSAITVDTKCTDDAGRRRYPSKEVYELPGGGGLGISKVVLDRIAAAAGVEWDTERTGRLDDGRDPNFVHYRAVGTLTEFDGTTRRVSGEKIIDLREGAPALDAIRARHKGETAEKQVRELRLFALEHAESKAKNRALRGGLGIKTTYTAEELKKPFVVPRLMLTGHSTDPARRREIGDRIIDAKLGASRSLYGAPPPAALPARRVVEAPSYSTPPVGAVPVDEDDVPPARPTPRQAPPAPPARKATPAAAAPPSGGDGKGGRKTGFLVPFGKNKGEDFADVDEKDLEYLEGAFAKSANDPDKGRFREDNERKLAAVRAELRYRNGEVEPPADEDPTGGYGEREDL